MLAATAVLAEFCAVAESWTTSPEFSEKEVGDSTSEVTVLLTLLEPPPQPARITEINKSNTVTMADRCIHPPRRASYPCGFLGLIDKSERFSVVSRSNLFKGLRR